MVVPTSQEAVAERAYMREMLSDSADSFARGELGPHVTRSWRGRVPPFDLERWKSLAAMGWTGLLIKEEFGGTNAGLQAACAVLARLGPALPPEPLVACAVLSAVVLDAATPSLLRDQVLRRLADGAELPALAHETPSRDDSGVQARRGENSWTLNGQCRFVRPGRGATGWIVKAETEEGGALFWVPSSSIPEHALEFEPLTDGGDCAWLRLSGIVVEPQYLLVEPAHTHLVIRRAIDAALIASSAELLGVMRGAFALALDHLRNRRQFGVAIGSFQALQHRAVDLHLQHELTSACVERASRRFDEGADSEELSLLAARSKARAADAAVLTSRETIQFFGAMGYTDECDIGLYFKRSLSIAAWLGNASAQRQRYAQLRFAKQPVKGVSAS
ncbi:MAG: acyl-CoA dehydrogenase family protein [Ottowia sp.]|uniref:acyl-CoA dehydrogenase family protein n=1 Tax=Ottowia sp. TaxID=1898956 RepID=UPI003C71AB19